MIKFPESRVRIRFKDCDPHGHLYNTRFIEYMLEAREDQLIEHYGLNLMDYAEQRKMAWILVKNEISYLKEAKRNEFVIIKTSLIHTSEKSLAVEYQMWTDDKSELKAILWSKFIHVDMQNKKTTPHPNDIQEILKSLVNPIEELLMEERVKGLLASKTLSE
jgi:acyl-CoA thioester hydrolase